jgi:tRNA nucleotidyltransferase/poly(A) polymerase
MENPRFPVHALLKEIAAVFNTAGKQVYLVGGAVRDLILGREAIDWDLATDAHPEEVMALFKRVIPTGIKHGTVTIRYKGRSCEVTTFRTESDYSDGRRPDAVQYAAAIEEDLSRRDFTMNAAAVRLPGGVLTDPYNGKGDIRRRRIRSVGNAFLRFAEDGLRPLRALRFAAQLDFDIEADTLAAIPLSRATTEKVAPERVREELNKIIASPDPRRAFLLMEETNLLSLVLPELAACRGVEQKGFHRFDVLDHSLTACQYASRKNFSFEVRLAALLHDIGKPAVKKMDASGVWTFYRHEQESVRLAALIFSRFRYSNAVRDKALRLIGGHMFHYEEEWSDGAVRRFIMRSGEENLNELFDLRMADSAGTTGTEPPPDLLLPLIKRIERVLEKGKTLSLKDLAVNGGDLLKIGVQTGRHMGIILKELLETVVDDPALNTRERLLSIAQKLNERYTGGQA